MVDAAIYIIPVEIPQGKALTVKVNVVLAVVVPPLPEHSVFVPGLPY
jgi:hypothetical protein